MSREPDAHAPWRPPTRARAAGDERRTGLSETAIRLAARGQMSLARARAIPDEALAAARALARVAARNGRPDVAITILRGLVALDPDDAAAARALGALTRHVA